MQVLVAELYGNYAHFKIHETTRENLSYPIPPRTTIVGMLAGIMGIDRNIYWKSDNELRNIRIGLQILNPIIHYFLKVNYQSSKSTINLGKKAKLLLHPDPLLVRYNKLEHDEYIKKMKYPIARGQNMPIRLNLLYNVRYRIFIHSDNKEIYENIKNRLKNHLYVYPPYLGHANLLANWDYIGEYNAKIITSDSRCDSVVPFASINKDIFDFKYIGNPILYNLPLSMKVINEKKEISPANVTLDKVHNVFLSDLKQPFYGHFNELYQIKINNNQINFTFLPT